MAKRHIKKQQYSIRATVFGGDVVEFKVPEVFNRIDEIACFVLSVVPNWEALCITKNTLVFDTKQVNNVHKPVNKKSANLNVSKPGTDYVHATKVNYEFINQKGIIPRNVMDFFNQNGR